jgi:DNA modification methylase
MMIELNHIYQGDCLPLMREMPDKSVDLVLTDPPYGINIFHKDGKVGNGGRVGMRAGTAGGSNKVPATKFHTFDDSSLPSRECFDEIFRISKNQIIFGGNYFGLPPTSCYIVWDKDNGGNDFADCELAWTSFKSAVRKFTWRWNGLLQEDMAHKEKREHPTQKPLPLMMWCLEKYSKPGMTILDPFMGSGTTCVACKKLGRNYIGIEKEPVYVEIAKKRLEKVNNHKIEEWF